MNFATSLRVSQYINTKPVKKINRLLMSLGGAKQRGNLVQKKKMRLLHPKMDIGFAMTGNYSLRIKLPNTGAAILIYHSSSLRRTHRQTRAIRGVISKYVSQSLRATLGSAAIPNQMLIVMPKRLEE